MKRYPTQLVIAYLVLASWVTSMGEEPAATPLADGSSTEPTTRPLSAAAQRQVELEKTCERAVRSLRAGLAKGGSDYPVLSDIGSAKIEADDVVGADGEPQAIDIYMRYWKNVTTRPASPDAQGNLPETDQFTTVNDPGAEFELYLTADPSLITRTGMFSLEKGDPKNGLHLIYYIDENPFDPKLEAFVHRACERAATDLSDSLTKIK